MRAYARIRALNDSILAEMAAGERVLGTTPCDLELERSTTPIEVPRTRVNTIRAVSAVAGLCFLTLSRDDKHVKQQGFAQIVEMAPEDTDARSGLIRALLAAGSINRYDVASRAPISQGERIGYGAQFCSLGINSQRIR